MTSASTLSIAVNIFRCNELMEARLRASHPCHNIATLTNRLHRRPGATVPEPWRGDVEQAPLLFIVADSPLHAPEKALHSRLDDARIASHYCTNDTSCLFPATSRWRTISRHAAELYDRSRIIPGKDFAVVPVVHCRSCGQFDIHTVFRHCALRHMANILSISHPRVIVCLGQFPDAIPQDIDWRDWPAPLIIQLEHTTHIATDLDATLLRQIRTRLAGGEVTKRSTTTRKKHAQSPGMEFSTASSKDAEGILATPS